MTGLRGGSFTRALLSTIALLAVTGAGCNRVETDRATDSTGAPASTGLPDSIPTVSPGDYVAANAPQTSSTRVEVDLSARQLHVYDGATQVASHPVAVGSSEWPTQTGEWNITQVVWNPEWIPPDESWAEEREPRKPGDPKNPLGRAQLIYDPPRTIHGTNDPSSIGKAVSHGSIRVSNEVAVQLARQLMEAGGAGKDEAWYSSTQSNRTTKQIVDLPRPVPIRVF
jgi:lipoprotein-anchoring transpeptidase ErfK/SrfK